MDKDGIFTVMALGQVLAQRWGELVGALVKPKSIIV